MCSESVMSISVCKCLGLLMGGFQWKAHEGKVFSLNWTSKNDPDPSVLLFSCGPDGAMVRLSFIVNSPLCIVQVCWSVHEEDGMFTVSKMTSLSLPHSKHRWISTVTVLSSSNSHSATVANPQTTVICGDRKGSVHVYHCIFEPSMAEEPSSYQEPVQSFRLHGPNGVTSIVAHGPYVYTAGRDGFCRKFSLGSDGFLTELSKFKV